MSKNIYVEINKRKIKYLVNDKGDTITIFKEDKHFFKKLKSFGIATEVIEHFKSLGILYITLIWNKTDGTQEAFKTSIDVWSNGKVIQQAGWEKQNHLTLDILRTSKPEVKFIDSNDGSLLKF